MALKGDLKEINLADIFQTLAMNRQVGTLVVNTTNKNASIYFNQNGIELLTSEDKRYPRLGEILLSKSMISEGQLNKALENQRITGKLLGEILVEQGTVSKEDIERSVRAQIEEIIYDVFSWQSAKFEFRAGEPEGEFFDPGNMGRHITLNPSGVIMEAARRIDEWELIHQRIPSFGLVFAPVEHEAAIDFDEKLEYKEEDINRVFQLVNGTRTVSGVCRMSPYSDFDTCKILALLVDYNQVRTLTPDETISLANRFMKAKKYEEAINLYESAIATSDGNVDFHERMAEALVALERMNEAAHVYIDIGLFHFEQYDHENARNAFSRATELAPRNFAAHQHLYEVHVASGDYVEAAKEAILLAKAYERLGKRQEAKEILKKTMPYAPDNLELGTLYANVLIDLEEKEDAIVQLESLGNKYMQRGMYNQAATIYRKLLVVDTSRKDVRKIVDQIQNGTYGKKKKGRVLKAALVVVIVLILLGLGAVYYYETSIVRTAFDDLKVENEKRMARADEMIDRGRELVRDLATLDPLSQEFKTKRTAVENHLAEMENNSFLLERRTALESFREKYGLSFFVKTGTQVKDQLGEINRTVQGLSNTKTELEEQKNMAVWRIFRKGEDFFDEGKLDQAETAYEMLEKEKLSENRASQLQQAKKTLRDYKSNAEQLFALAKKHEMQGDYNKARESIRKLTRLYRHSEEARAAKIPFRIESSPPGAEIEINGVTLKDAKTPHTYYYSEDNTLDIPKSVKVSKKSYDSKKQIVGNLCKVTFQLHKIPNYVETMDFGVKSVPVMSEDMLFAGTARSNGTLQAVHIGPKKHELKWRFTPSEQFADVKAPPVILGNVILYTCNTKTLYAIDRNTGGELWKTEFENVTFGSPTRPDENGVVYVGTIDGKITGVSVKEKGKIVWQYPASSTGVPEEENEKKETEDSEEKKPSGNDQKNPDEPEKRDKPDENGNEEDRPEKQEEGTGETPEASEATPVVMTGDPVLEAGRLYFAMQGNLFACFDLKAGKLAWKYDAGGTLAQPALIINKTAYFGTEKGDIQAVDVKTGKKKWNFPAGGRITGSLVYGSGTVFFGGHDGNVYALDAETGSKKWRFATGGAVKAAPLYDKGTLYVGTSGKRIFALATRLKPDASRPEVIWDYSAAHTTNLPVMTVGDLVVFLGTTPPVAGKTESDLKTSIYVFEK